MTARRRRFLARSKARPRRILARSKVRFRSARTAWHAIHRATGIPASRVVRTRHTARQWRFEVR